MHDKHNMQDVTFTDTIDKAEYIRYSSRIMTSKTVGFPLTELCTTQYVRKWTNIIDRSSGLLSDRAINWIRVTENIQLDIPNSNLLISLEKDEKFNKICDLNKSFATEVTVLEAAEAVQDRPR